MTNSPNTGTPTTIASNAAKPESSIPQMAAVSLRSWICFLFVAILGLAADLSSKHAAFARLGYGPDARYKIVIPDILEFRTTLNGGAVFGIGTGLSLLFILVSLVAMAFVVYVFMSSDRRQGLMHVALGLILAGAAGNLYDRMFNQGMVRDFIYVMHYWPWIFNVADAMLCIGVPLLILCWLLHPPRNSSGTER
jgi:signal peptidase II